MASISINSFIANQTLGAAALVGPAPVRLPVPPAENGAVFTRSEPWRNQVGDGSRPGYTRKDARGQGTAPPLPDKGLTTSAAEPEESPPPRVDSIPGQASPQGPAKKPNGELLSKAEMALLRELQKTDQAVKAHEMAHLAAAGGHAKGGASFSYQRGPDGQNYAVGGEVQVDTSPEATPEATIQKMQIVRQAALAPIDPSPQDQRVAAQATLQISEAFKELRLVHSTRTAAPPQQANQGDQETARGIYQAANQSIDGGTAPSEGGVKPKKNYAAYLKLQTTSARPDHQGLLDRIA